MARKVLASVIAIACLFVCMTSMASAQQQLINFENLNINDEIFSNTPLLAVPGPGTGNDITVLYVNNDNNQLNNNHLDGDSGTDVDAGSFWWDFNEPLNGTGTLSRVNDNAGGNFSLEFSNVVGGPVVTRTQYQPATGYGYTNAWSGNTAFDNSRPVTQSLTTTWVNGTSDGQNVFYRVTQQGRPDFTATFTSDGNASVMRMFYDRRNGQNIDFDDFSFIVPEPGTVGLLLLGLVGMGFTRSWIRRPRNPGSGVATG